MFMTTAAASLDILCATGHPPYQHDTSNYPRPAIGYIRVSTEKQDKEERGLERQTERLLQAAPGFGLKLTHIYDDTGSGRGAHNEQKRPGLMQSLREARVLGVPLIVTSASRLSRDWASFEKLAGAQSVQIVIVDEGGRVDRDQLMRGIQRAEDVGDAITEGASRAARGAPGAYRGFGDPEQASAAAGASAALRTRRHFDVIEELADVLEMEPKLQEVTHKELVEILNARGMLSSWSREWTYESLRKMRSVAMREVAERRAMNGEIADEPFPVLDAKVDIGDADLCSGGLDGVDDIFENRFSSVHSDVEVEKMHPDYGYFGSVSRCDPYGFSVVNRSAELPTSEDVFRRKGKSFNDTSDNTCENVENMEDESEKNSSLDVEYFANRKFFFSRPPDPPVTPPPREQR
jgi:hypothetical protein